MAIDLSNIAAEYRKNGFVSGVPVLTFSQTEKLRGFIEKLENKYARGVGGHSINQFFRVNAHVVIPELANLTKKSNILNIVEKILGPNLLAWSVELFIKEPGSKKTVSWHQDITYWGMGETDDEVTAWIALTDVSITAGCMRFIPESHKGNIVDHTDTFDEDNLLSRGQKIPNVNIVSPSWKMLSRFRGKSIRASKDWSSHSICDSRSSQPCTWPRLGHAGKGRNTYRRLGLYSRTAWIISSKRSGTL